MLSKCFIDRLNREFDSIAVPAHSAKKLTFGSPPSWVKPTLDIDLVSLCCRKRVLCQLPAWSIARVTNGNQVVDEAGESRKRFLWEKVVNHSIPCIEFAITERTDA